MKATATGLAIALAMTLPGCAASTAFPRAPTGLRVGSVTQASSFEKNEAAKTRTSDRSDSRFDGKQDREKANAAKRRKAAFWSGVGLAAAGAGLTIGFGIGGRVVQGQIANGYDDEDLTHADEDRLRTTGEMMNGLTIGSVLVALVGVGILSVSYALDHARCGDLPPKRDICADRPRGEPATAAAAETSKTAEKSDDEMPAEGATAAAAPQ